MEVAKPELLGVVDDDRIGVGHVDAALHDTGGYQYVILIIHEIEDDLLVPITNVKVRLIGEDGNAFAI